MKLFRKYKRGPLEISDTSSVILNIIFIILSLACLVPVLLVYITSFTAERSIIENGFSLFPEQWSVKAYTTMFDQSLDTIINSYKNTLILTVAGTFLGLLIMTMYAYAIARQEFTFRKGLTFYAYFTMLFSGGLVASYIINCNVYGLRDTFWVLLFPGMAGAYNIIVLRTFFSNAGTESLIEAAKIDGAGEFRIYAQIILPISKPALATIGLFLSIAYFSSWFNVLLYIDDRNLWTIQYMLQRTMREIQTLVDNPDFAASEEGMLLLYDLPNESAKMALTVISMTPVLLFYPYFQKYFIKGLTLGAVKG